MVINNSLNIYTQLLQLQEAFANEIRITAFYTKSHQGYTASTHVEFELLLLL